MSDIQQFDDKVSSLGKLKISDHEKNLWVSYWTDSSDDNRDAIVEYYIPLISRRLKKSMNRLSYNADTDSMMQSAYIAASNMICQYDGSSKFMTFIDKRIFGAAIDESRRNDFVPARVRRCCKIRERLEMMGSDPESVMSKADFDNSVPISLDSIDGVLCDNGREVSIKDYLRCKLTTRKLDRDDWFMDMFRGLSLDAQTVLYLYYVKDQTMTFIGQALNITKSRVGQIHSDVINRLRERTDLL